MISTIWSSRSSILSKSSEYSISGERPNVLFHNVTDSFKMDLWRLERLADIRTSVADKLVVLNFGNFSIPLPIDFHRV